MREAQQLKKLDQDEEVAPWPPIDLSSPLPVGGVFPQAMAAEMDKFVRSSGPMDGGSGGVRAQTDIDIDALVFREVRCCVGK